MLVRRTGGPEVLEVAEVAEPVPGPSELRVDVAAAGVNFIDVYHRTGKYPLPLPFVAGSEGAGTVSAVGEGVHDVAVGDRVAWAMVHGSGYAEQVLVAAERVVPVPDGVEDETAAAVMLQGLTAQYLTSATYDVGAGDVVLVHAAAGGVGLLLTQVATARGARVIATTSTQEKADLARAAGASDVVLYTEADLRAEVRRLTAGEGVHVVYDGVGRATFEAGLDCLRPRGTMVLFGASSGAPARRSPTTWRRRRSSGSGPRRCSAGSPTVGWRSGWVVGTPSPTPRPPIPTSRRAAPRASPSCSPRPERRGRQERAGAVLAQPGRGFGTAGSDPD